MHLFICMVIGRSLIRDLLLECFEPSQLDLLMPLVELVRDGLSKNGRVETC